MAGISTVKTKSLKPHGIRDFGEADGQQAGFGVENGNDRVGAPSKLRYSNREA